jgi:glycosyltransferase involved in cell wall biosynthesis
VAPAQTTARPRVYFVTRKGLTHNGRIFKQARSLTAAGYDVVLFGIRLEHAPAGERREGYEIVRLRARTLTDRLRALRRRGVPDDRPAVMGGSPPGRLARVLRPLGFVHLLWDLHRLTLREVARRDPPSIVHANDLDSLLTGLVLARRYDVPLVYDAQEFYPGVHRLPAWCQRLLIAYERALIKRPARVIAVNAAIARVMEDAYGRPIDAVVLNCAPYVEDPRAGGRTLRERLALPAHVPVYLYCGGLAAQRGIENTVLALQHVAAGVLVILGEGPLKAGLEALVAREGLQDRVFFFDFVAHDDVTAMIASADVGVVPIENAGTNHYLCSPSKLFHYIQAELPVASSDFPVLRSIVADHEVGALFDPASPRSIAAALDYLVADPDRQAAIRERLRSLKRRYCWEREEERFLEAYRSLPVQLAGASPASNRKPLSRGLRASARR